MPPGPVLIFDKSTLQSLNPEESLWLDNFFLSNITPAFFVEVLADLEKEVGRGRTPEEVVGSLAYKTPDMQAVANVHHTTLLDLELSGLDDVDVRFGRPLVGGGHQVALDGQSGFVFKQGPEAEALARWQQGEFLDVERQTAKGWRKALSNVNLELVYEEYKKLFNSRERPKTLRETKAFADWLIDLPDQEDALRSGLAAVGYPEELSEKIVLRWRGAGQPIIRRFAPYFTHVLSVNLVFCIALAADLVSRERPSNLIDVAYLYYLPFCMVFASNDRLHTKLAPLFLRDHQQFVEGSALKADLARIDQHFSSLPEDVRKRGVSTFGSYPPDDGALLVGQLWDRFLPRWREHKVKPDIPRDQEADKAFIDKVGRFVDAPVAEHPSGRQLEDADIVVIQRYVRPTRGKWLRFPPEALRDNDQ